MKIATAKITKATKTVAPTYINNPTPAQAKAMVAEYMANGTEFHRVNKNKWASAAMIRNWYKTNRNTIINAGRFGAALWAANSSRMGLYIAQSKDAGHRVINVYRVAR